MCWFLVSALPKGITSFEDNTHSQIYRTLTAAARLTPKIAEKANTDLTTSSDRGLHGHTCTYCRRVVSMAVQPISVAGGARVSGEAQPVCGIAFGKGDPLSSSERLSMGSARATTLPRKGAQLLTTLLIALSRTLGGYTEHYALLSQMCDRFKFCVV